MLAEAERLHGGGGNFLYKLPLHFIIAPLRCIAYAAEPSEKAAAVQCGLLKDLLLGEVETRLAKPSPHPSAILTSHISAHETFPRPGSRTQRLLASATLLEVTSLARRLGTLLLSLLHSQRWFSSPGSLRRCHTRNALKWRALI